MAGERLSDQAWARLLGAKQIGLGNTTFPIEIAMEELADLGQRQPRLMLSMDTRDRWPKPLKENGVFPLAVSRSKVLLLKGDGWFDLSQSIEKNVHQARLPFHLASSTVGRGENAHVMRLETSGFLASFLGTDIIIPVASGRRVTPKFDVFVHGKQVQVQSAQYEMDAQYESADDIIPVEMKAKHYDSCAIRQLYFPYRSLGEQTDWAKPVRPLFISYREAEDEYIVREIGFRRKDVWESIYEQRVEGAKIQIVAPPPVLDLSGRELEDKRIPQADSIAKIAKFPLFVARGMIDGRTIAEAFGFNRRQSSYYRDAVQSLGFVELVDNQYRLTQTGRRYVDLAPQGRVDFLGKQMSKLPVIKHILVSMERAATKGLHRDEIPHLILEYAGVHNQQCNQTTAKRRASTIRSYLEYLGARTGTIVKVGGRFYLREPAQQLELFDNLR